MRGGGVAVGVENVSEPLEARAGAASDVGRVFSDAAREDQGIDPLQDGRVGADVFLEAVAEDLDGQPRPPATGLGGADDLSHVVRDAREAQQATPAVQQVIDLIDVHAERAHEVEDDGRVDVAAAGSHDQAFERRHAQRGVHARPAAHRRDAAPVSEVGGDEVGLGRRAVEHGGCRLRDVPVARSVKPVPADAVLRIQVVRNGVQEGVRPDGLVKRRIEDADVRDIRHEGHGGADADQVRRIVQGSERHARLDGADDLLVDERALGEPFGAVDAAMTDGVYPGKFGDDGGRTARQGLDHKSERRLMVGRRDVADIRGVGGLVSDAAARLADSFDDAGGQDVGRAAFAHRKERVLDARGAAVDDQDVHPRANSFGNAGAGHGAARLQPLRKPLCPPCRPHVRRQGA